MQALRRTLFLLIGLAASAQADFGDYQSHRVVDQTLVVTTNLGELRIACQKSWLLTRKNPTAKLCL